MQNDNRKLTLPEDVENDAQALELVSVWHSEGKAKILTRSETLLDKNMVIWSEIVAGIIENIADHACEATGRSHEEVAKAIWSEATKALSQRYSK